MVRCAVISVLSHVFDPNLTSVMKATFICCLLHNTRSVQSSLYMNVTSAVLQLLEDILLNLLLNTIFINGEVSTLSRML